MNRKLYQIQLPADLETPLKAIALELGDVYKGNPSPTRVVTRIAQRDYAVVPSSVVWTEAQRQATQEVLQKLQPMLLEQKPFRVLYRDSQGEAKDFTARYGRLSFWERRYYLDIWTADPADSGVEALRHNRCLRIDRILEVHPARGKWRTSGLDALAVRLELRNGLVKAYERKPEDIALDVVGDRLIVTRQISNVFWFCREALRYGKDAVVLEPDEVRGWLREEIQSMWGNYEDPLPDPGR